MSGTESESGPIESLEYNIAVRHGEVIMGEKVYLLWFVPEGEEIEDTGILIGVYDSEAAAQAAIERLRHKRGFVDYPQGFQIHSRELGQDSWTDGFFRD